MNIRDSTKKKYTDFLYRIGGIGIAFNADEEARKDKVDLKIVTFLRSKGYLMPIKDKHHTTGKETDVSVFSRESVPIIFEEFLEYRDKIIASYEEIQYLLKHKELAKTLLGEYFNPITKLAGKAELSRETIAEIVNYVKLATDLGKTNIVEFVQTLYNIK